MPKKYTRKSPKKQTIRRPHKRPLAPDADLHAYIHHCQVRKVSVSITVTAAEIKTTENILRDAAITFTQDGNSFTLQPTPPVDPFDMPFSADDIIFFKDEESEPEVVDSKEAALILGISVTTFRKWANEGIIQPYELDDAGQFAHTTYLVDEVVALKNDEGLFSKTGEKK